VFVLATAYQCLGVLISEDDIPDNDRGSESDFGPSRKEKENEAKTLRTVKDKMSRLYERREEEIHYCCKWGEK
jgi:hypothetical protein